MAAKPAKRKATTVTKTTVEKKENISKFAEQLRRDNSSIRDDRAKRISESVSDAQDTLIRTIKDRIRKAEGELDSMMDLSSDNQSTSMNVISPDFNADDFVGRINDLKVAISLDTIKLDIAQDTKATWF